MPKEDVIPQKLSSHMKNIYYGLCERLYTQKRPNALLKSRLNYFNWLNMIYMKKLLFSYNKLFFNYTLYKRVGKVYKETPFIRMGCINII